MTDFETSLKRILEFAVGTENTAADDLMKRYRNHQSLAVAEYDELEKMPSVGADAAMLIRLAYCLASRAETDKFKFGAVHTEDEILDYLRATFYGVPNETVYALLLDDRGRVTFSHLVSEGPVNASAVLPRRVLELAVKGGARSVILAHNHPLGYATPSVEDVETTHVLKRMLESTGRELLAHYVIASDGMYYKIDPNKVADE